jgi:diguanylate cyclase (GGDEF)-like protein
LLLIDATPYAANENRLIFTAIATSAFTILFSLFIAYSIYRFNLNLHRLENVRLGKMVRERTIEIEQLSKIDSLTGLWNRGYLEEMMTTEFKRSKRFEHELTLLILDLDHFKNINDAHGHLGGDEVLREMAKRIKSAVRDTDFIGRYGGEEFVIILSETSLHDGRIVAEKLRTAISDKPVLLDDIEIPVTTSIGVSDLRPLDLNRQQIVERADQALYQSKHNGRNQVSVYVDKIDNTAVL